MHLVFPVLNLAIIESKIISSNVLYLHTNKKNAWRYYIYNIKNNFLISLLSSVRLVWLYSQIKKEQKKVCFDLFIYALKFFSRRGSSSPQL